VSVLLLFSLTRQIDTVTDFSWEPKGERFAIVSSSDPNLGNAGAGVTIKTDISFYQLDHSKNDFRLLRVSMKAAAIEL
jgi:translation initiation factor 3 subunit B